LRPEAHTGSNSSRDGFGFDAISVSLLGQLDVVLFLRYGPGATQVKLAASFGLPEPLYLIPATPAALEEWCK
jgi:hypothetical protein